MTSDDQTDAQPGNIQAVTRVGQLLRLFHAQRPVITASEVAQSLGWNRTTSYRYCTSLVTAGLLRRGPSAGSFIPGELLLQVGALALGQRRVLTVGPAHLRALASSAHVTAVLSVWNGNGLVVSAVEEDPARDVVVTVRVGTHLSITSAQAATYLAFQRDAMLVGRLLASVDDDERDEIREHIEAARRDMGSAMTTRTGISVSAAPVFDDTGICATMALVGTQLMVGRGVDGMLTKAAQQLTHALGGVWPEQ